MSPKTGDWVQGSDLGFDSGECAGVSWQAMDVLLGLGEGGREGTTIRQAATPCHWTPRGWGDGLGDNNKCLLVHKSCILIC